MAQRRDPQHDDTRYYKGVQAYKGTCSLGIPKPIVYKMGLEKGQQAEIMQIGPKTLVVKFTGKMITGREIVLASKVARESRDTDDSVSRQLDLAMGHTGGDDEDPTGPSYEDQIDAILGERKSDRSARPGYEHEIDESTKAKEDRKRDGSSGGDEPGAPRGRTGSSGGDEPEAPPKPKRDNRTRLEKLRMK